MIPYKRSKLWVDDVPAYVEIFSDGKILLCYWPLLGAWSTQIDFPEEGVWLSPTEIVKNITYRSDSKESLLDIHRMAISIILSRR